MTTRAHLARGIASLILIGVASNALAEQPGPPCAVECRVAKARELLEAGNATDARVELLAAYELEPQPALLFALGQVELKLGNYDAAIGYYDRFIATGPSEDQVALAQQALGAARMQLTAPRVEPVPPAPRFEHRWNLENTGLVILGGAAIAMGSALLVSAHRRGNDRSGTLADYEHRLDLARTQRLTGIGVASAGASAIVVAIVRWRLDQTRLPEIRATAVPGGGTVSVERRW